MGSTRYGGGDIMDGVPESIIGKILSESGIAVAVLLLVLFIMAFIIKALWARLIFVQDNFFKNSTDMVSALQTHATQFQSLRTDLLTRGGRE